MIRFEQFLGLYHEEAIQQLFLPYRAFIQFWNTYYGTAHFVVTLAVFALLFWKRPGVFPVWRNSLGIMTGAGHRRLRAVPADAAAAARQAVRPTTAGRASRATLRGRRRPFGFVDTLSEYGGPWSFDSDEMASISNQYAAMPSMHIGWSMWCAVAVWPLLRRRWQRAVVFLYPAGHAVLHHRDGATTTGSTASAACSASPSARRRAGACTAGTRTASTASSWPSSAAAAPVGETTVTTSGGPGSHAAGGS